MSPEAIRPVYTSGECEIDLARRELRVLGSRVPVGARAFEIIEVLAESAGDLVTKDELMRRIWPGAVVMDNTLQVHAAAVRKALGRNRTLLKTEARRGYRLLGEWTVRSHQVTRSPPGFHRTQSESNSSVTNLPASVTRLIGRSTASERLQDLISAYRLVTLTGPGGIGKTSLALLVARRLVGDFADGCRLVELASLSDPELVPPAIAHTLGLELHTAELSAEAIARRMGEMRLLLVLDNCEHVIDAVAIMAETILRLCQHVTILATSREVLRLQGEYVYRVPPLDVPTHGETELSAIPRHSAVELFIARTTELDSSLSPAATDLPTIAAICRHLDGIPLAIEFAAARAATLGINAVAASLADRFSLLTAGRRTAPQRHRTLRAALDWSYDLLPKEERLLLRRLAIFPGGFTDDAAVAVMKDAILDPSVVRGGIASLVAKSLIVLRSDPVSRWHLLETIRVYAFERLTEQGEYSTAAQLQAEYLLNLLVPVAESSTYLVNADDLDRCRREIDNVRAALDWSFSPEGNVAIGVILTAAFASIWSQTLSESASSPHVALLASECRNRVEDALPHQGAHIQLSATLERRMFIAYSHSLATTLAPTEQTRAAIRRVQQLSAGHNDIEEQVHLLWTLWTSELTSGDYKALLTTAQSLREVAQRSAEDATRLLGDRYLGTSALYAGRLYEARDHLKLFVDHYVAPKNGRHAKLFHWDQHLVARSKLALVSCLLGELDTASEQARISFEDAQSESGFTLFWVVQDGQCRTAIMTGDLAAAGTAITAMDDYTTRLDFMHYKGVATVWKGKLLIERGAFAQGVELIRQAINTCEQMGCQMCHAEFLGYLTEGLVGLNRLEEAHRTIERALTRAQQFGEGLYHAELIRIMGELLLLRSSDTRASKAENCFRKAIELAHDQGALFWELRSAISLARWRLTQGRVSEAKRVLGPVYHRFSQGFGTPELRAAKELLEELTS